MDEVFRDSNVKGEERLESSTPEAIKSRRKDKDRDAAAAKRRCVSTACIACRRRKSKASARIGSLRFSDTWKLILAV